MALVWAHIKKCKVYVSLWFLCFCMSSKVYSVSSTSTDVKNCSLVSGAVISLPCCVQPLFLELNLAAVYIQYNFSWWPPILCWLTFTNGRRKFWSFRISLELLIEMPIRAWRRWHLSSWWKEAKGQQKTCSFFRRRKPEWVEQQCLAGFCWKHEISLGNLHKLLSGFGHKPCL